MSDAPDETPSIRLRVARSPAGRALFVAPFLGTVLLFASPFTSLLPWMPTGAGAVAFAGGIGLFLVGFLVALFRDGHNLIDVQLDAFQLHVQTQSEHVRLPIQYVASFDDRATDRIEVRLKKNAALRGPLWLVAADEPTRTTVLSILVGRGIQRVEA